MTTSVAVLKSKIEFDVSEYIEGSSKIAEETKAVKREVSDFADAAAIVGDKFDDTEQSIDKWIGALQELSPETQKFRGEWEGILDQFRSGEADMETTKTKLEELQKEMKGGTEGSKDYSKGLSQLVKGFFGVATAYAAGRAIISFAKDSMAASRAVYGLTKEEEAATKATDRLKVSIGRVLQQELQGTTGWFTELKNEVADFLEIHSLMNEAEEKLNLTWEEKIRLSGQVSQGLITAEQIHAGYRIELEALAEAEVSLMSIEMQRAKGRAERGAALNQLAESMGIVADEASEAANAFEGVEVGITGMIESALQLVQWEQAGGAAFADKFKAFWDKVVSGAITDEAVIAAALQMFEGAALGLEQEVGEINWYAAAVRYQKQFGGTIWEANKKIVFDWYAMAVLLGEIDLQGAADEVSKKLGIPFEEALATLFGIHGKLRAIDGMVSEADVVVTEWTVVGVGTPPGGGGGGGPGAQGGPVTMQHGGRFFAGQTMLVGEGTVGGELVTAGAAGNVISNASLDNSGIEERLDALEWAMITMGEDILTGIQLAVS